MEVVAYESDWLVNEGMDGLVGTDLRVLASDRGAVRGDDGLMDKLLVLINGLPGSGKTTLGHRLAGILGAAFLSKDTIKEALWASSGNDWHERTLGGPAMDVAWALAQAAPASVVIDSWWFKPRDLAFAQAGVDKVGADRVVEIWCQVPVELARARYANRGRAALHQDDRHLLSGDWDRWAEHASPLGLAPVVFVDTTGSVDYVVLAERLAAAGHGERTP